MKMMQPYLGFLFNENFSEKWESDIWSIAKTGSKQV